MPDVTIADPTALERRDVESDSRRGLFYPMLRTPSGWCHEDAGCEGWLYRLAADQMKPCKHVIRLTKETDPMTSFATEEETGTALAVSSPAYRSLTELVEDYDAALIVQNVDPALVENWGYAFPMNGSTVTGLSVYGVMAAAREMTKHGEVLRSDEPNVVYEDDLEIRLACRCRRFLVQVVDGKSVEVEVDSTVRSLRQSKKQKINIWGDNGHGGRKVIDTEEKDDEKWFEKAYSKAVRNATLPLLRDDVRSTMLAAFKATPKYAQVAGPRGNTPQRGGGASQQQRVTPPAARQVPAPPSSQVPMCTPEQAKVLKEQVDALNTAENMPVLRVVLDECKTRWPYAVNENTGQFLYVRLTSGDAQLLWELMDGHLQELVAKAEAELPDLNEGGIPN